MPMPTFDPATHQRCPICQSLFSRRGFLKHFLACKERQQDAQCGAIHTVQQQRTTLVGPRNSRDQDSVAPPEEQQAEHETVTHQDTHRGDTHLPDRASLPRSYVRVQYHPHSGLPDKIVSLDDPETVTGFRFAQLAANKTPHAPFRSNADFTFSEMAVGNGWSAEAVNSVLKLLRTDWVNDLSAVQVSFRNNNDLQQSLAAARQCFIKFQQSSIKVPYRGQEREIKFRFREPLDWIRTLVQDPTLVHENNLFSCKKFLCLGNEQEVRMVDEPWTGDDWAAVDTNVADGISMHPIVLRALWLPAIIRNASGNAGGILIGYMPVLRDDNGEGEDDNHGQRDDFFIFKRVVYQQVLGKIFECIRVECANGLAMAFADGILRIIHIGILIISMDAEELSVFNACRAHNAKVPCPRCTVTRDQLVNISKSFPLRTTKDMERVVLDSRGPNISDAQRTRLLRDAGLHPVELQQFMWRLRYSDPYRAPRVDTLHSDDIGKWGHHLWPLLKDHLKGNAHLIDANMDNFPRWRGLKHFKHIMTVHYADGEKHLSVMKSILPVVVQFFSNNNPLIHCIRAYIYCRMLIGLTCVTDTHLATLKSAIIKYERFCKMTVKDENQEAIAAIRMCIDNEKRRAEEEKNSEENKEMEAGNADPDVNPATAEDIDSFTPQVDSHWQLGSPSRSWEYISSFIIKWSAQAVTTPSYTTFEDDLRDTIVAQFPNLANFAFEGLTVTYRAESDILRCTTDWYRQGPRRDCIIIESADGKPLLHVFGTSCDASYATSKLSILLPSLCFVPAVHGPENQVGG
ncbi:hypothetical protein BKA62DRAFT_680276, partial [Auriculariales sp. MPI-PUGE-AT-0066]